MNCFLKYLLQASENLEDAHEDDTESIKVSKSPEKPIKKMELNDANVRCRLSILVLWKTPSSSPFFSTAKEIMSAWSVHRYLQGSNKTRQKKHIRFLRWRKWSLEDGAWKMTDCRPKYYSIVKDEDWSVAELERVQDQSKLWLCCPEKNIHVFLV